MYEDTFYAIKITIGFVELNFKKKFQSYELVFIDSNTLQCRSVSLFEIQIYLFH